MPPFRGDPSKVTAVHLPEDIIIHNILVRLPVKSILRFRCVSKAWYKLLRENPRFVKLHLKHATETNKFNLILMNYSPEKYERKIYTIGYDPLSRCSDLVRVNYPFESKNSDGVGFWGSENGLVCFSPGCMVRVKKYLVDIVVVWNPATGEYKKLPPAPIVGKTNYLDYGFGYDGKIDDFKVVALAGNDKKHSCQVHVYTLGSNSWIAMEIIPYKLSCRDLQVPDMGRLPVNGSLHWIAFRRSGQVTSKVILSFNFEKQAFGEMELPNMFDDSYKTSLCVLEGSLCLLGHVYEVKVDLWELKNYGVENSWTKLFTIDVNQLFGYVGYLVPLRRFENGEFLLGFDKNGDFSMGLYDSELQTFKTLRVYDEMTSYSGSTSVYVESLHSLHKGTYLKPAEEENFHRKCPEKYVQIRSVTKANKPVIWWEESSEDSD